MSGKILKRALALCLCMLLLAGSCLAEDSLEDFVPDALTEEELAQWQEWAEEGMGDSDATAANAAELTPEEESLMAEWPPCWRIPPSVRRWTCPTWNPTRLCPIMW